MVNLYLAGCLGGVGWILLDVYFSSKWSLLSFSSGVLAGLIAMSSGASFVPAWTSLLYGLASSVAGNLATRLKYDSKVDDALDTFALHTICGVVGNVLTGFFAK